MDPLTYDVLQLIGGIVCAWLGGEAFVRGLVNLALWARIPAAVVGVTVAAFATSSPELAVAVRAAADGVPQISLGDTLGSNIVNLAMILGLAVILMPLRASLREIRRDFCWATAVPLIVALLAADGRLSRFDGGLMAGIFLLWISVVVLSALRNREAGGPEAWPWSRKGAALGFSLTGLILLMLAGRLIVVGGKGVALAMGMSEFVVGATVVAIATGMPELATTLVSIRRKHDELGLANVLGSNIFNGLFIISVLVLLHPFSVPFSSLVVALIFGLLTTLAAAPLGGRIGRIHGVVLLALYAGYLALLLAFSPRH